MKEKKIDWSKTLINTKIKKNEQDVYNLIIYTKQLEIRILQLEEGFRINNLAKPDFSKKDFKEISLESTKLILEKITKEVCKYFSIADLNRPFVKTRNREFGNPYCLRKLIFYIARYVYFINETRICEFVNESGLMMDRSTIYNCLYKIRDSLDSVNKDDIQYSKALKQIIENLKLKEV